MDERLRFVARLLDGEKMASLCREFDISRKTGYKIFARYKDCGIEGLTDRSRRPYRHANEYAGHGLWLLLLLGLRSCELLNAKWIDVDWDAGTLFVGLTKNGEPLLAPLSDAAMARLRLVPRIPNNPYGIKIFSLAHAELRVRAEPQTLSAESLLHAFDGSRLHRHYFTAKHFTNSSGRRRSQKLYAGLAYRT